MSCSNNEENQIINIDYLTQCVCLSHSPMTKFTPNQNINLANIYCLLFALIKPCKKSESILVNQLTQCVLLNHFTITKYTQNQHSQLANT